jgi:hypothetical protein
MKTLILALAILAGTTGCKAIQSAETKLDSLSDAQLAAYLQEGAAFAAQYGLQMAQKKFPKDAARIKADAAQADTFVRQTILQALQGAPTGQVVLSMMGQFGTLVENTTLSQVELAVGAVIVSIPLPKNPADKLSPRAQASAVGFFTGLAMGIEKNAGITPAPPVAPAPPK